VLFGSRKFLERLLADGRSEQERLEELFLDAQSENKRWQGLLADGHSEHERLERLFSDARSENERLDGLLSDGQAENQRLILLVNDLEADQEHLASVGEEARIANEELELVRKETAAYPRDAAAWMWEGVIQLAMDRPEDAAASLDKAASLAPDNVDVLYHRGQAHLLVSKNSYGRMFKADPKSWRVRQVLAEANADAERHLDAIAEYQEAIKLAPTQPGLHEELGSEFRNAGKPQEAEAAFERELEIDPYNVLARYKLGVLAIERNDGARAKELIEAALRQKPGLRHSAACQ